MENAKTIEMPLHIVPDLIGGMDGKYVWLHGADGARVGRFESAVAEEIRKITVDASATRRAVQIIRDLVRDLGPGLAVVPSVRAAHDFLGELDEPLTDEMKDEIASRCAQNFWAAQQLREIHIPPQVVADSAQYVVFCRRGADDKIYDCDVLTGDCRVRREAKRYTEAEAIERINELTKKTPKLARYYGYERADTN